MKKLKKYCIWIVVSLIVQTGVLYYFSNYYLVESTNVTFKPLEVIGKSEKPLEVKVPENASNIKLSCSGNYALYTESDNIHVINLQTGTDNQVKLKESLKMYYFKWQENQDKIVIAEKVNGSEDTGIKMYQYDPKDNEVSQQLDYSNQGRTYNLHDSSDKVSDIKISINTILYVKTNDSNGESAINRLDISDGMYKMKLPINTIGNYEIIKSLDKIIYEDSELNRLYITKDGGSQKLSIPETSKPKLLSVDRDDNIYVGNLEGSKIDTVYYKGCSADNWNNIKLKQATDLTNIFILRDGNIYTVDNEKKSIVNVKTNKKMDLKGSFIDINTNAVLSMQNGKLIRYRLKA